MQLGTYSLQTGSLIGTFKKGICQRFTKRYVLLNMFPFSAPRVICNMTLYRSLSLSVCFMSLSWISSNRRTAHVSLNICWRHIRFRQVPIGYEQQWRANEAIGVRTCSILNRSGGTKPQAWQNRHVDGIQDAGGCLGDHTSTVLTISKCEPGPIANNRVLIKAIRLHR
jgi:hypothetical protein